MQYYTTGEIAKLCGVSVRTVQYYDTRNILKPSELSEGGRRLYTDEDLQQMRVVCFLRDAGFSINGIAQLLAEEDPSAAITHLLDMREEELRREIEERKNGLAMLEGIRRRVKGEGDFSLSSLGDVAYEIQNKSKMRRLHLMLLIPGILVELTEWAAFTVLFVWGNPWGFLPWACASLAYLFWSVPFYFRRVAYICPSCHKMFRPKFWEVFWANHTPTMRKLTCPHCQKRTFCLETYRKEGEKNG